MLEQKVQDLEAKVDHLSAQLNKCMLKVDTPSTIANYNFDHLKLHQQQNTYINFAEALNHISNDDMNNLNFIDGGNMTSFDTKPRKEVVQNYTKQIVDQILPPSQQIILNICKEESKLSELEYATLLNSDLETFGVVSKDSKLTDFDTFMYYSKLAPKMFNKAKNINKINKDYYKKFKTLICKLFTVQNQIVLLQEDFSQNNISDEIFGLYFKNDANFKESLPKLSDESLNSFDKTYKLLQKHKQSFFSSIMENHTDVEFNFVQELAS